MFNSLRVSKVEIGKAYRYSAVHRQGRRLLWRPLVRVRSRESRRIGDVHLLGRGLKYGSLGRNASPKERTVSRLRPRVSEFVAVVRALGVSTSVHASPVSEA